MQQRLRSSFTSLQQYLGQLTVTHQLLIGSMAIIMLMALFLVSQYAGKPKMVELLESYSPEQQQRAINFVRTSHYADRVEDRSGRLYVKPSDQTAILAALAENEVLPDDTTILFGNLLDKQKMWQTHSQHETALTIAIQNELGRIIKNWNGIGDAQVLIDAPPKGGLGRTARRPTASVSVHTTGGSLSQKTVDAIANFVAGAQSGLDPANIRIIDATTGQPRTPRAAGDFMAGDYIEAQMKHEQELHKKLHDMLSYIPGVVVAVTAQIDMTRSRVDSVTYNEKGDGTASVLKRSSTSEEASTEAQPGDGAGLRSQAAADINNGSGGPVSAGNKETRDQEFDTRFGQQTSQLIDPRGYPKRLVATVNVPRSYILGVLAAKNPGSPPDPAQAQTQQLIDSEWPAIRAEIEQSVRPHLAVATTDANPIPASPEDLHIALIPVGLDAGIGSPLGEAADAIGQVGWLALSSGGMMDKIVVGALGLVALAMMFMMVRKAGKRVNLPSPQEVVGVPPPLRGDTDLVGEADESETPMTGIEVDDDEVRISKMLEEVGELVTDNPDDAVKVLSRWVSFED